VADTMSAARAMWTMFEPAHDVTYFTPEALQAFTEAGLRGYWRGYFAGRSAPLGAAPAGILLGARILWVVSAFRCLFPVLYRGRIAFHDTFLSSVFVTRFLATFSEIAYISQLALALHLINAAVPQPVAWIEAVAVAMVVLVTTAQCFVWGAILADSPMLFFYEELCWEILFAAHTLASAYLRWTLADRLGASAVAGLLNFNIGFGLLYLPWQVAHLKMELADARAAKPSPRASLGARLRAGLSRAIFVRNPSRSFTAWRGWVGLTWMTAYWATLIPLWVYRVVVAMAP